MTAVAAPEAAWPDQDAFCDALTGLACLCRRLALVIGDAATPDVARSDRAVADAGGTDDVPDEEPDELLDAVLGLVSLRTTAALVLAALCEADADDPGAAGQVSPDAPAWSRELLR
jgi:hypothetical protein